MNYKKCSICGHYGWTNTHKCPPEWLVCQDLCDGQYKEIYADDPASGIRDILII
jgi:hypothetical protein